MPRIDAHYMDCPVCGRIFQPDLDGYTITGTVFDNYTDNGDGTFTLDVTGRQIKCWWC